VKESDPSTANGAPRVTVLLAVYNGEEYIGEAIRSVLEQSYRGFELLIVDDGSTDGTPSVIQTFHDPRIRVIQNPANLGLSRSLNLGIGEARGEYIARLDADDLCRPARLERQVRFLDEHPEVALVGCGYEEIDSEGVSRGFHDLPCEHVQIRWRLYFVNAFVHSAVMFRRSVVNQLGRYDDRLEQSQDFELWSRIARKHRVANLPDHLIKLRLHPNSMMGRLGARPSEGQRFRLENVGRLLGWTEGGQPGWDERFTNMSALLRNGIEAQPVASILRAQADVLELHERFCRTAHLTPAECMTQSAQVRRHLAGVTFGVAARRKRLGADRDAWILLKSAARLHRRLLRSRRFLTIGASILVRLCAYRIPIKRSNVAEEK
jgi:glycosyltransferase involved in cell wall biosynthesis